MLGISRYVVTLVLEVSKSPIYQQRYAVLNPMRDFSSSVRRIAELEKKYKSGHESSLGTAFTSSYERLLTEFPFLEGFWIRWAHTEYRLRKNPADALAIFEKALNTHNLSHSVTLWVGYLRFLIHVSYTSLPVPTEVLNRFEQANKDIGSNFLSHEFWDLYLEVHPDPISLLIDILDQKTLHQFAKYYAMLIEKLDNSKDMLSFKDLMPLEVQNIELNSEELPRVKNVIMSKLKLKYELHLRRVNAVLPFEQKIKQHCFSPFSYDSLPWVDYIKSSSEPLKIYERALIICSSDTKLWLAYIRYCHSLRLKTDGSSLDERKIQLEAAYAVPLALRLVPVMLHYALWLEYEGRFEEAKSIYEAAESHAQTHHHFETAVLQHCQFLSRNGDYEASRLHLKAMVLKQKSTLLESELQKVAPRSSLSKDIPSAREVVESF